MSKSEAQDIKEYIHEQLEGVHKKVDALQVEIQEHKTSVVRWCVSLFVGFSVLVLSGLTLSLTATFMVVGS